MAIGLRMRRRAVPYYAAGAQNVDPFAKAFAECHRQAHGALFVLLNRVVNAYVGACDFAQLKVLFGRCTRDDGGTKQLSLLDDANARGKARVVATLLPFFCSVVNTVRERHKVFVSVAKLVGILTHEYNQGVAWLNAGAIPKVLAWGHVWPRPGRLTVEAGSLKPRRSRCTQRRSHRWSP